MWWYNAGIALYEGALRVAARFNPKAAAWVDNRRGLFERLAAAVGREEGVVWVHAASLGEFEQGRPVIEQLRREAPGTKILLTFFSPSGYGACRSYPGAEWVFSLPADRPRNARRFMDIVRPRMAIFIKYEFWLNYLGELKRRHCPALLVSAHFMPGSVFFRPWGGAFRRALGCFTRIFVQDEASVRLLRGIGIESEAAGDTRFDRVAEIAAAAGGAEGVDIFRDGRALIVAGSTWPPDEDILLPLIEAHPETKFIIAPHELHGARLARLAARLGRRAVLYSRCREARRLREAQVLIVDTVGLLSTLYRYASAAYIGGGFGAGIHNTLEAAAYGVPAAFGPNHGKFPEALGLIACGGARSVGSAADLEAWFSSLQADPALRERAGRAAARYVAAHRGATRRITDFIMQRYAAAAAPCADEEAACR